MKKILWVIVACLLVTVLASAEDDPMVPAFGKGKIRYAEFKTKGTATQTSMLTGDYLGTSLHEGYVVELDGTIQGISEMSPDFMLDFLFNIRTKYYCEFYAIDYEWDREKNKLKDTDTIVECYDRIGQNPPYPEPFVGPLTDCKTVFNFSTPDKFKGTIICKDEDPTGTEFKGIINGTRLGTYNFPQAN